MMRFIIFFISCLYFSQNKTFIYELDYKPNSLKDSIVNETFFLDIQNNQSIFRSPIEKKSDSLVMRTGMGYGRGPNLEAQRYVVKDLKSNSIYKSIITRLRDYYSINIDEKLDWQILPEKDKIASMNIQKAQVTYGGRKWVAWFTNEIPIPEGPYIFHGLPGLIVSISDDKKEYIFKLVKSKNSGNELFMRPKGTEMSYPAFQKLMKDYFNDPFSELKIRNLNMMKDDGNGNPVKANYNEETKRIRKLILKNNNPIELNYKNDYKVN
ncbi:GLPGLI family protein [Elizabethkingia anophelis]|uniref:GLPGLI family protein n=1 Tax=Elizabethkingia anophelis TaxID=1117645 RepID=A0A7Z7LU88_9FLAO|nr:GLPGLI family protein [Elizabethkingia anophelis]STC98339.1 GLPGLI family protein [Elizabethkingia anophelis]